MLNERPQERNGGSELVAFKGTKSHIRNPVSVFPFFYFFNAAKHMAGHTTKTEEATIARIFLRKRMRI